MRPSRAQIAGSGVLPNYTLDTLFGVKGTIRLVPQSGAPKAHILLKRGCCNEESLNLEPIAGVARFTLVANKRFTASKGQILCLSVEDPAADDDAKLLYGENAVSLEFDYDDESDLSEPEDEGDEGEDVGVEIHAKNPVAVKEMRRRGSTEMGSLPAKMRKSLAGSSTYNTFAERQPPNSLGFPGYPLNTLEPRVFASAATQTERVADEEPAARPFPFKHVEQEQLPLSPISTNNYISRSQNHRQSPVVSSRVFDSQSENSDLQEVVSPPRSPSPMDLSTTTTSHPGSPEDPPWTPSSPTNDHSAFPLPSTAATTPTPSPKLELHPQEADSPREGALLTSNGEETKHKHSHPTIKLYQRSVSPVPTHPHQDEDMFAPETFFIGPQASSTDTAFPLQPCKPTSLSQSIDDSATLPTPLATPKPLSRLSNTPAKQRVAQPEPFQRETCHVQPSLPVSVQSFPTTSSSGVPSAMPPLKVPSSYPSASLSPAIAEPKTTRPPPTSIPTQPKAHRLLQAHISAVTPTPQPSISNPLGIRPSLNKPVPKGPRTLQAATSQVSATYAQPAASASTSTAAGASTKKPVVVGSKWMPLRGTTSTYASTPAVLPATSTSLTKAATLMPTLKLTLAPTSSPSEITTSTCISAQSKSQPASLDDLLRYTPSPPPSARRNNVHNQHKSKSSQSVVSIVEKPLKVLPGFVPAVPSVGGLLQNPASGDGSSSKTINVVESSTNASVAENLDEEDRGKDRAREDGEMSDDGSGTVGLSKLQAQVGVKTETQKRKDRKERANARWAAKAAEEAAKWKEVGSQTEELPALPLSLKRPRESGERIPCHSCRKEQEKAREYIEGEQLAPPEPIEEDMMMETDDENTLDGEVTLNKAMVNAKISSGPNLAENPVIPNNETPNVLAQSISTADQGEDMMIESDEEDVNQPSTKRQKTHDTRDSAQVDERRFVDDADLRLPKKDVAKGHKFMALASGALVFPPAVENGSKPLPVASTSSQAGVITSATPVPVLGGPTDMAETKQKKKRRKKAKSVATELTEFKIPGQGGSAKAASQEDVSQSQAAKNTPSIATDMLAAEKAVQAAIEKVEREEREREEREDRKNAHCHAMEMLDIQISQKKEINSNSHLSEPAITPAGTSPIMSKVQRLAHPLPAKPVIPIVVNRKLHRPASPIAVPVSIAPVIETTRGRSSTRSPGRRRTSVNSELPRTPRGRSGSINSSRGWGSPEVRREQTRSRGRDRSRSDSASRSRSRSRDVRKYTKRSYSVSRSRRRRRARSRSYSTSPLRSPSWSRSRRGTSSIASSRSRSRSVAQQRGRVEKSKGRRRYLSRSSRGRSRRRSRSRSRTRSRKSLRQNDCYDGRTTTTTKAPEVLKIKEEVMEAQIPRPKAPAPRVGRVANTNWPATNSNAQFTIKHFDVPSNDVSIQKIVFGQQGRTVAVACSDSTVRLWETKPKIREAAQVSTTSAIAGLCWMDGDSGFLTLGIDGQVALHIQNLDRWNSSKLFNMHNTSAINTDVPTCMVYTTGKIAVATATGVKVWFLNKGVWQPQRDITRSGVTTLKFLPNGDALVGGCRDGLLWYCEVPNGTLRAYAFMPSRKAITAMDMHASSSHLLVTQEGGSAYLVALRLTENKGIIERTYTSDKIKADGTGCGAIFATCGQALVFGSTNGCALVWDRKKGSVVYGLKHPNDDKVQAMSSFDGKPGVEGMIVSGTKKGSLFWWPIPRAASGKS